MSEMNIKPFRFFTQAILPLDYDDTLSYYECLAKVTAKLNETINVVDVNNENMQSLHDAYVQLESFVNSYFDDLDVQAEIDNKLDEMVTDGTLLELIQPFVDDEIADAVGAWLEENITPTTPAVDATLLVSGAAADSKTVGDKLKADVAPAYSASATYAVGDYVLYDHTLYKCNTAISTAEAWTAAHWTAINVTDEISDLNDAISEIKVIGEAVSITGWAQGYIRDNGTIGSSDTTCYSGTYKSAFAGIKQMLITPASGYKVTFIVAYNTTAVSSFVKKMAVNAEAPFIFVNEEYVYRFVVAKSDGTNVSPNDLPSNVVTYASIGYTDTTLTLSGKPADSKTVGDAINRLNNNLFNPENYNVISAYPNESTRVLNANTNTKSVYIPCDPNTLYTVEKTVSARFSVADFTGLPSVNSTAVNVIQSDGANSLTIKTGSESTYLLCFVYLSTADTLTLEEILNTLSIKVGASATGIIQQPFTLLPDDFVNTMSYKPMAKPSKGYICLVSDDGKAELATYAIPMVINKNVPITMAVMSTSEVFDNGTMQAVVLDAVQNHGCEISQHGGVEWTTYNELKLRKFIASEKTFFSNIGLIPKSAVIPAHKTTPLIEAVMGGIFGVVRSGYRGLDENNNPGTLHDYYDYYESGEGSNLYGLSSFNLSSNSLAYNQSAIDYAYENHKVLICYWHENALTAETKTIIEDSIDYAKTVGLEFITLDKLSHLIDLEFDNGTM